MRIFPVQATPSQGFTTPQAMVSVCAHCAQTVVGLPDDGGELTWMHVIVKEYNCE